MACKDCKYCQEYDLKSRQKQFVCRLKVKFTNGNETCVLFEEETDKDLLLLDLAMEQKEQM